MTKISVITPLREKDVDFIEDLNQSLSEQLFEDFEWVIVKEKAFQLTFESNLKIKMVINEFENGVAGARNTGIKHAKGEYLYFLDCDDLLSEHTFTCFIENLQAEEVDIVIGQTKKITKVPTISTSYRTMFSRLLRNRNLNVTEAKPKQLSSSSLNILFKRNFILDNNISFDTSMTLYSDLPFNFQAFDKADKIVYDPDAFYLKMTRNDPLEKPSLLQEYSTERVTEYPKAYKKAKDITEQEPLRTLLDNRLSKAYYYDFIRDIYSSKDTTVRAVWETALKSIDKTSFGKWKKYSVVEIKSLAAGHYKLNKLLSGIRILGNKLLSLKKPMLRKRFVYENFFTKLPIKNNVIFYESFLGRNYSDSPKYIYQYLNEQYPGKYKHVWCFDGDRSDLKEIKHKVNRFSLKYFYYLATSKFFVNNMRQPVWYEKRANQVFLETWHGTPLKKLVFDMDDVHSASPTYKMDFYVQQKAWDYLVSANAYSSKIFRRAFRFENEMLEYGYPRNDLLNAPNRDAYAKTIKDKLGIPDDKKVVLYAPTWRDDEFYGKGKYKFSLKLDLKRLKEELGDEYFFILRTHYFIADQLDIEGVEDVVYNGSHYDDIAELYLISDILITDYSSVFFDYANLKRPILFYAYDLDKYKDQLRGFYLNHQTEWPGPILQTNDDVIKTLKNIDQEYGPYQQRLEQFHAEFCKWDDGNASKNVAEEVIVYNKSKLK